MMTQSRGRGVWRRLRESLKAGLRTGRPALTAHLGAEWPEPPPGAVDAWGSTLGPAAYAESPWVYLAVNRIAEAGALVPLHVYAREGESLRALSRHPLEVLLDAPNPQLSRFELMEQTLGALELSGNAYWLLVGDARGLPVEIWPLRPDRVAVVPDAQGGVKGYVYTVDGESFALDAVEVLHFKRWHPANDYYGTSALAAAGLAVRGDRAMAQWNQRTFGQGQAVPAGIVNIREYVSDEDFARIKAEWRSSYGSGQRRTAFVRGGSVAWQHIGLSHQDLDFLRGRQAHRDEILSAFGVPVALVSENATEANAKVAERLFIERTLYPKLVRLAGKITQGLLPFWGPGTVAAFEDIRPTDVQARLDELRAAVGVLSVNELRARYFGMGPVPWGDRPGAAADAAAEAVAADVAETVESAAVKAAVAPESESVPPAQLIAELRRWERYALRRFDAAAGGVRGRAFAPTLLPDALAFELQARVMAAESESALRVAFASARRAVLGGASAGAGSAGEGEDSLADPVVQRDA